MGFCFGFVVVLLLLLVCKPRTMLICKGRIILLLSLLDFFWSFVSSAALLPAVFFCFSYFFFPVSSSLQF